MKFPSYPKYKDSGVEWLGEVPEHWEVKRGRFCMQVNPRTDKLRALGPDDEVSFVPMDVVGEYGGLRLDTTKPLADIGTGYTELQNGDVVVAKITPCFENWKGALAENLFNGVAMGTTELHVLRSLQCLDAQFLFYLTLSNGYRKTGEAEMYGAGGQKRVPPEFNKDFRTPLPTLHEQRAIAAFLDAQTAKIDTLIAKKRELIDKLKEKRAALITRTVTRGLPPGAAKAAGLDPNPRMKDSGVEWLGEVPEHWGITPLGYLIRMAGGGTPDKSNADFWDGDIPWVSPKDMKRPHLFDAEDHITAEAIQSSPATILPLNSVLIVVRGMILAHSFPVALSKVPLTINQDMKALICLKRLSPEYLFYIASGFAKIFVSLADGSAHGTRKIETDVIRHFPIALPAEEEQRAITIYLDHQTAKLDQMTIKVESAIERLQEYRSALITAAVTGKIDIREVSS